MRLAVTIGHRKSDMVPVIITGPEVPLHAQRAALHTLAAAGSDSEYALIELWTSDAGRTRRKRLHADQTEPAEPAAPAKPRARKPVRAPAVAPKGSTAKAAADKAAKKAAELSPAKS